MLPKQALSARMRVAMCVCDLMQVSQGYMQSLRPERLGLALQVDMAVTAFLEPGPVIDYLQRAAGLRDPRDFARASPIQLKKANKAIIGIKVRLKMHLPCLTSCFL